MSKDQLSLFASGRLLLVAFEGWNDAGEAATLAVRTIANALDLAPRFSVDPELYYDYQFSRPTVRRNEEGRREIVWPRTEMLGPVEDAHSLGPRAVGAGAEGLHVLWGSEPARSWKAFTAEIVDAALVAQIDAIVFFGAMLADAPHTRPLSVFASSEQAEVRAELDVDRSSYEGPIGIVGVLSEAAAEAGIPSVSLWAAVPHYVHAPPSPKAALALIRRFEDLSGIAIPLGSLESEAAEWEANVDLLAASDEDMAGYITQLEQARDEADAVEGSGDQIAEEFERYLRRADEKGDKNGESPRT